MPYKNIEIDNANTVYKQAAQQSHFYKGFSTVDNTNTGTQLYDFDLIKQDILNHFNTKKGQRVMNPEFGSIIWDLIMEPMTEQVKELLVADITKICNFDPRVVPIQMNLNEYPSGYLLELTLQIKGTDQSSSMRLAFDQKTGLSIQ
jgi:hypothetical protein